MRSHAGKMYSASHIVISLQIAPSFLQAKPIQQLTNIHGPPLPHRINLPLLWNQSVSRILDAEHGSESY